MFKTYKESKYTGSLLLLIRPYFFEAAGVTRGPFSSTIMDRDPALSSAESFRAVQRLCVTEILLRIDFFVATMCHKRYLQ